MQPRLLRSPARLAGSSLLRLQSDERLVALARDGHEQAFATIVERYRSPLERYAARIGGAERAEDAVQQALVSAHAALVADPERHIELRPWLYRIVHNSTLNLLRSARDDVPLDAAAGAVLGDDAVEHRARLREALDAVSALPAPQRDAILLRELEGRSHDEIAAALGVSPGAARQHLFRARNALRAAVTAITPQPLLARLLFAASSGAAGAPGTADVAAAGGASALIAKATAGVLATGAIVGGAVGSGVVHAPRYHHGVSALHAVQAAGPAAAAAAATPVVAHGTAALEPAVERHRPGRRVSAGRSPGETRGGRRGPGSGSSSGEDHRGPGSGSDDGRRTSGTSSSGGDHGATSGSSPGGEDHGGGSGSGSDGGRTASSLS